MSVPQKIDLTRDSLPIISGHLNLGGTNPQGRTLAFNNYYMMQDGKPCIPVMGEFHFSRYSAAFWEGEILKMKAGGISIIATYVFWIHIEEEEGIFDWSGNNNLRQFIELCAKHQIDALVRIGPFAHGECRNGGIPDWMYGRAFRLRSNDEEYLAYVKKIYSQIARQLNGLLFKDGGPVIGIQLENEYMHCGAPWEVTFRQGMEWVPSGTDGAGHIAKLKQVAQSVGLEAPIYSCTGWRNSPIVDGEILPMQGGYAFTPWSPDPNYRQEPTREFLFRNRHLDPVLGAQPTYKASRYPFVCCEIGGGIQDTYYHRPIVPPESVEALAVMNLAGGSNLIGYYMYHGGSNPVGKYSYMNEYTVPRISYDFQSPLREFGQVADSYRHLRLVHLFLKTFDDILAPMSVVLPENSATITPENTKDLRFAVRTQEGTGFIFLNNYQDHVDMRDITDIRLQLHMDTSIISLPYTESLTLQKNVSAILPFGLSLSGIKLTYATTQLLTKIDDAYFFFAPHGMISEYAFDPASYQALSVKSGEVIAENGMTYVTVTPGLDCLVTLTTLDGKMVRIFTLTRQQAEQSTVEIQNQRPHLLISEATIVAETDQLFAYHTSKPDVDIWVYPPIKNAEGYFSRHNISTTPNELSFEKHQVDEGKVVLKFPADMLKNAHNILLRIDYLGDIGQAYIDGKLVHDNFYNGTSWEIGLRQLEPKLNGKELLIMIVPVEKHSGGRRYVQTGMAFRPDADGERIAAINQITLVPEYKTPVHLS